MDILIQLERALHSPDVRNDPAKLQQLLHPEFRETGASGTSYDFQSISAMMQSEEASDTKVLSKDFEAIMLSQDIVLLLYKSCLVSPGEPASHYAKRSSIWVKTHEQWQVKYHQGTPCESFPITTK